MNWRRSLLLWNGLGMEWMGCKCTCNIYLIDIQLRILFVRLFLNGVAANRGCEGLGCWEMECGGGGMEFITSICLFLKRGAERRGGERS
jgi:hypothetical protein